MQIIHFFHLAKILFEPRHTLSYNQFLSFLMLEFHWNNRDTLKMPWVEILATSSQPYFLHLKFKMHNLRVAVTLIKRAPKPALIEKTVNGFHA